MHLQTNNQNKTKRSPKKNLTLISIKLSSLFLSSMQSKKFSTMNVKSQQLKLVKMKGPSKDASVPLGREKKVITSGKEEGTWEGKWTWEVKQLGKRGEPDMVLDEGKGL